MNNRDGAIVGVLLFFLAAGQAQACRVPLTPLASEAGVQVEVTVVSAQDEPPPNEHGAWKAIGRLKDQPPPPLKSSEVEFYGYSNLDGCLSMRDRPAIGSRWLVNYGVRADGATRMLGARPLREP